MIKNTFTLYSFDKITQKHLKMFYIVFLIKHLFVKTQEPKNTRTIVLLEYLFIFKNYFFDFYYKNLIIFVLCR